MHLYFNPNDLKTNLCSHFQGNDWNEEKADSNEEKEIY